MAIRFYCPFCEQLLGISSRQAGAAVGCPRCGGVVGVPPEVGPRAGGVVLSAWDVAVLALAVLALTGLAFAAGLLVGALF